MVFCHRKVTSCQFEKTFLSCWDIKNILWSRNLMTILSWRNENGVFLGYWTILVRHTHSPSLHISGEMLNELPHSHCQTFPLCLDLKTLEEKKLLRTGDLHDNFRWHCAFPLTVVTKTVAAWSSKFSIVDLGHVPFSQIFQFNCLKCKCTTRIKRKFSGTNGRHLEVL